MQQAQLRSEFCILNYLLLHPVMLLFARSLSFAFLYLP